MSQYDHSSQSSLIQIVNKLPEVTQFDEFRVAQQSQQINIKSIYGVSLLRDLTTTAGAGTVTNDNIEYKVATTANGADSAQLSTADRGRYISGQSAIAGLGVRIPVAPTGNQVIEWGYFDSNNGFGFGYDATGLYVFIRRAGVDTKVYQSNWNTDKLDGTTESDFTLNPSVGLIYQIHFSWYGYGVIEFNVLGYTEKNEQHYYPMHRLRVTGSTSILDPNQPITVKVSNGGTAAPLEVFVAGRQFATLGEYSPLFRISSERILSKTGIGTTFLPVISMRRKSAFLSTSVKVLSFDLITDFDAIVQVRKNATLTTPSWQNPTEHIATETAMESDTTAASMSGGIVLYQGLIKAAGQGAQTSGSIKVPLLQQDAIDLQPITLTVRRISGTGGTVSAVLSVLEEW